MAATDHARNAQAFDKRVSTIVDYVPPWVVFNPPLGKYTCSENFEVRWSARIRLSALKVARRATDRHRFLESTSVNEVSRPSDNETIYDLNIAGANQDQFYQFEITCLDNVGNTAPGPATAITNVSLYPGTVMSNVTPNYTPDVAPIQLGWKGDHIIRKTYHGV